MDGIDKLFIESDTEDTNVDNKDEQGQKIPGKGDKKKVVGKSKEEEEKHGNCDGRQEKVVSLQVLFRIDASKLY